jgi:glycosyltransferase involved in cell wall biosynthesis
MRSTPNYAFLSIFKWEHRKGPCKNTLVVIKFHSHPYCYLTGWDVLLEAYFNEFSPTDDVVLYIHTYLYLEAEPRNESRIRQIIVDYAKDKFKLSVGQLPSFVVLVDEMKESDMPKLYKAVDAYVMPSRGEGWGLPALEGTKYTGFCRTSLNSSTYRILRSSHVHGASCNRYKLEWASRFRY